MPRTGACVLPHILHRLPLPVAAPPAGKPGNCDWIPGTAGATAVRPVTPDCHPRATPCRRSRCSDQHAPFREVAYVGWAAAMHAHRAQEGQHSASKLALASAHAGILQPADRERLTTLPSAATGRLHVATTQAAQHMHACRLTAGYGRALWVPDHVVQGVQVGQPGPPGSPPRRRSHLRSPTSAGSECKAAAFSHKML